MGAFARKLSGFGIGQCPNRASSAPPTGPDGPFELLALRLKHLEVFGAQVVVGEEARWPALPLFGRAPAGLHDESVSADSPLRAAIRFRLASSDSGKWTLVFGR
jgi:hypothetical protein